MPNTQFKPQTIPGQWFLENGQKHQHYPGSDDWKNCVWAPRPCLSASAVNGITSQEWNMSTSQKWNM